MVLTVPSPPPATTTVAPESRARRTAPAVLAGESRTLTLAGAPAAANDPSRILGRSEALLPPAVGLSRTAITPPWCHGTKEPAALTRAARPVSDRCGWRGAPESGRPPPTPPPAAP